MWEGKVDLILDCEKLCRGTIEQKCKDVKLSQML